LIFYHFHCRVTLSHLFNNFHCRVTLSHLFLYITFLFVRVSGFISKKLVWVTGLGSNIFNLMWDKTDRQTDRHCTYNVTLRRLRLSVVAVYLFWIYVYILALVIQHSECMSRIIPSSMAYFYTTVYSILPHKRNDFRKILI
jgi:hypothetical protein